MRWGARVIGLKAGWLVAVAGSESNPSIYQILLLPYKSLCAACRRFVKKSRFCGYERHFSSDHGDDGDADSRAAP